MNDTPWLTKDARRFVRNVIAIIIENEIKNENGRLLAGPDKRSRTLVKLEAKRLAEKLRQ